MSGAEQDGSIVVPDLDGETVTADDFDEAVAAGIRRRKYLAKELKQRKDNGQAYALAEAELRFLKLALHAVRVQADELRGDDTPLSLLEEAKREIEAFAEATPNLVWRDELLALLERMGATIRRLT